MTQLLFARIVSVLLCATWIASPILIDGYFTHLDNPSHLAEILSLATSPTAWVDIAYSGFAPGHYCTHLFGMASLPGWSHLASLLKPCTDFCYFWDMLHHQLTCFGLQEMKEYPIKTSWLTARPHPGS